MGSTFVVSCVTICQRVLIGLFLMFTAGMYTPTWTVVEGPPTNVSLNLTNASSLAATGLNATVNTTLMINGANGSLVQPSDNNTNTSGREKFYVLEAGWYDYFQWGFYTMVALPLPECLATYLVTIQSNQANHHNKNFVVNSLYVGLGYATGQTFLILLSTYYVPGTAWYDILHLACSYMIMSAPLQMLVGYGMGLMIAEAREKELSSVALRTNTFAWFVRSIYYVFFGLLYYQVYSMLAFHGSCLVLYVITIAYIKHVERSMPAEYLAKVGYMHFFGYGRLAQVDELLDDDGNEKVEMQEAHTAVP